MEAKRIFGSRLFLAVLAGLLILNGFFFVYQQRDQRQIGAFCHEQLAAWEDTAYADALLQCTAALEQEPYSPRYLAWQQLESQYTHLVQYPHYLEKIRVDAQKLQSVSLFSDPNSIGYQNTLKTAEDFTAVADVTVTPGHDLAVTAVFEDAWVDDSLLLVILLVCGLFTAERKEGLWPMVYAAAGGRGRLAWKRMGILLGASVLASVLLIGSKVLLSAWMYQGLGEWDRSLQSIPMFYNVPTPMTVGQFWLWYLVVKALGAFWIGLVIWAVLAAISHPGLAFAAAGLLLGVEYACTFIPPVSAFAMARYVNVLSYVNYIGVFTRYLNLNVGGVLISGSDLVLWTLAVLCPLFMGIHWLLAQKKRPIAPTNPLLRWWDRVLKWWNPRWPVAGEWTKLLLKRRGLLLLALLGVLLWNWSPPPRALAPWDPYIHQQQAHYAGPITEDTLPTLEAAMETAIGEGNIQGILAVMDQARTAPEGAWIVPTAPYDAIFSGNLGNHHHATALMTLLFLVLVLAPIGSQERQNGVQTLLCSTGGRNRLRLRKHLMIVGLAAVIWLTVYGSELWKIIDVHGQLQCPEAPALSLKILRDYPSFLSLGGAVTLYYLVKLPVLVAVGELCFWLSTRCDKNRDALLLTGGTLLLPAALATIGSKAAAFLSFLVPLAGQ